MATTMLKKVEAQLDAEKTVMVDVPGYEPFQISYWPPTASESTLFSLDFLAKHLTDWTLSGGPTFRAVAGLPREIQTRIYTLIR